MRVLLFIVLFLFAGFIYADETYDGVSGDEVSDLTKEELIKCSRKKRKFKRELFEVKDKGFVKYIHDSAEEEKKLCGEDDRCVCKSYDYLLSELEKRKDVSLYKSKSSVNNSHQSCDEKRKTVEKIINNMRDVDPDKAISLRNELYNESNLELCTKTLPAIIANYSNYIEPRKQILPKQKLILHETSEADRLIKKGERSIGVANGLSKAASWVFLISIIEVGVGLGIYFGADLYMGGISFIVSGGIGLIVSLPLGITAATVRSGGKDKVRRGKRMKLDEKGYSFNLVPIINPVSRTYGLMMSFNY